MQRAIWTIVTAQEFLRQRATRFPAVNQEARRVIADLRDTWQTVAAYGIAAPQIGVSRRLFVYRTMEQPEPVALVNPKILRAWGELKDYDGCLSVPGIYGQTRRAEHVEITGLDESGERVRLHFSGFDARIIQHEFDHLDGVLFIDRLDDLDDLYVLRKDPDAGEEAAPQQVPLSPEQREFIREHQRPLPAVALRW